MNLLRKGPSGSSVALIIGLMLLSSCICLAEDTNRTGTSGNQPLDGFSEGTEVVEIYHNNGVHDTVFDIGEKINIRITTNLVASLPAQDNNNRVTVQDHLGNKVGPDHKPFFTKTSSGGPPHVYEGSFDASPGNDFEVDKDYLLEVVLRESSQNKVVFTDVVHIGTSPPAEERYIELYSDPGYTTESYEFPPTSPMYIEVWTGPNATNIDASWVYLSNYQEEVDPTQMSQLIDPTVTTNGNYSRFSYDFSADFGDRFDLQDGYWYTLSVRMNDGTHDQIEDWSVQLKINHSLANPPMISQGDTMADPDTIVVGIESTTISTNFTHQDSPDPSTFVITYSVKDETGTEYVLVDGKRTGSAGLVVVQDDMDPNEYMVSYQWSPGQAQPTGMYDLRLRISDGITYAEDAYLNNEDELELLSPPAFPVIQSSATHAMPDTVKVEGNHSTVLSVNFTHEDAPPADGFKVTFKVRDPGNSPPLVLVDGAQSGSSGLLVEKTGANSYRANFTWDPPQGSVTGSYDLFSKIEDTNGAWAEDPFDHNLDELTLTKEASLPVVVSGATQAKPDMVNRTGTEVSVISTLFHHDDMPGGSAFTVTYQLRDEDNSTYILVDSRNQGHAGLTILDLGDGDYKASYAWDPPTSQPTGSYDIYFMVEDHLGHQAIDPFEANTDELTVTKKPTRPVIQAGITTVDPAEVNILGNGTLTISTRFSHQDRPQVSTFRISFAIRDLGNQEYDLLESKSTGTPGLTVVDDGTGNYTASYVWDPPSVGQPLGTYDLYAMVMDGHGHTVEDVFNNNLEELTLVKETIVPQNATLSGKVLDLDGDPIQGATVKIYNSSSDEVLETLTTDLQGEFSVDLHFGLYDVAAQATGYKGETVKDVQLDKDETNITFSLIQLVDDGDPVIKKVKEEVVPGYMYAVLALLFLLVILLLLMLGTMSRRDDGEEKKKKSPHHAHERDEDDFEADHPLEPKEKDEIEHEPKAISPDKVKISPMDDEDEEYDDDDEDEEYEDDDEDEEDED